MTVENVSSEKEFRDEFAKLMYRTSILDNLSFLEKGRLMGEIRRFVQPHVPNLLYRYRKCRIEELISFEQGTISLCVADKFSDKYDSTVFYDYSSVSQKLSEAFYDVLPSFWEYLKTNLSEYPDNPIKNKLEKLIRSNSSNEEISEAMEEDFAPYISALESFIKSKPSMARKDKLAKMACFTESVTSKYMWDMYADGYKGFVLGYDLRDYYMTGLSLLYPIIYTSERYDATEIIERLCAREFFEKLYSETSNENIAHLAKQYYPIDSLHWIKLHLYKDKEEYAHEKEWRVLEFDSSKKNEDFLYIPDGGSLKAIYYGPDIELRYKNHLSRIAKTKGIDEYNVVIDENNRQYHLKVIPIE